MDFDDFLAKWIILVY